MEMLDQYFAMPRQIYAYFGYVEDWRIIPLDDSRGYYWKLKGGDRGALLFAETPEILTDDFSEKYYKDQIYTQRHLPRWVYRGAEYTLVVVDTHMDGNKLLRVFDNAKEC